MSALWTGCEMGSMSDNPCRYCVSPKRNEWCHGVCKEYTDWRAEKDVEARKRYQDTEADVVLAQGAMKRKIRHYRRGGKH